MYETTAPPDDVLAGLSPTQLEAVTRTEGHFLVLAGAGSGKTRVITRRIAHLLIDRAVPAHRILALTFTNKAAREMRERVAQLLGEPAPKNLWIQTFHSLGARLLRFHGEAAGLRPGFSIFDDDDTVRLIKRLLKELGFDPKQHSPGGIRSTISRWKCELVTPAEALEDPDVHFRVPAQVFELYENELRSQNAVDFGDLLTRSVEMLRRDQATRERYQRRFRYLLVDEYQDTNKAQYQLVRLLAGEKAHVCAVGDEDQSIYGWRGADIRNILDFQSDFPGTEVLQLDQNYRCPQPVLEAANAMIQHNASRLKEREVFSEKTSEHRVGVFLARDADQEGRYIADAVRYLTLEEGMEYSDFAVLYRTNAQARSIEQALLRSRIPYRIFGGQRFYDRRVIKDLVCYLRLLLNERDQEALLRVLNVPKRGIGPKRVDKLVALSRAEDVPIPAVLADPKVLGGKTGAAGQQLHELLERLRAQVDEVPPVDLLDELVEALDYESYVTKTTKPEDMELVGELRSAMVDFVKLAEREGNEPSLLRFLEEAALVSPTDELDPEAGQVSLMTLHNAKGLEFPVVFVTGIEDGLLPHVNSAAAPDKVEEERRLFYVGMTRAQQRLFLTCAAFRTVYGTSMQRKPSPFLQEIGEEHLEVPPY